MMETTAEKDVLLIKATFKDNEKLLKLMRSLWFGADLTSVEKEQIRSTFKGADLRDAVRRKTFAQMGDDAPIGNVPDFWLNVTSQQLIGASRDAIYQIVQSKSLLLGYFKKAIALLENPDGERVDITYDAKFSISDELQIKLLARNQYVQAMETTLHLLNEVAKAPEPETPAQTAKKLVKNSSK